MFFSGCVGILFCPFCHNCARDVGNSTLIAGEGLHSWQHAAYGSSLCSVVMGQKHTKKPNLVKEPAVFGVWHSPPISPFPLAFCTLNFTAFEQSVAVSIQFWLWVCHLVATMFANKVRINPLLKLAGLGSVPHTGQETEAVEVGRHLPDFTFCCAGCTSQLCCPLT